MSLPLDPYLSGMCSGTEMLGEPRPLVPVDPRMAAGFAVIFAALLVASTAYVADPVMANMVKRDAIALGLVKPPRKVTLGERVQAEAGRWGFVNGKAVGL